MVAAYSRRLTSAFAYGDNKPLDRCVTMGEYTRANTIANRMKVPRRMMAFIAVWYLQPLGASSLGLRHYTYCCSSSYMSFWVRDLANSRAERPCLFWVATVEPASISIRAAPTWSSLSLGPFGP